MRTSTPIQRLTILLLTIAMFYTNIASSAEPGYILSASIADARKQGLQFDDYSLFANAGITKQYTGTEEVLLSANNTAIATLLANAPKGVLLGMQYKGKTYTLALLRNNTFSAAYKSLVADDAGTHTVQTNTGLHYQGAVQGDDKSVATMSVFANGEVMILFSCSDGNFVAGKMKDNSGQYVLYDDAAIRGYMPFRCALPNQPSTTAEPAAKTTAGNSYCKPISFYWEADYGLYRVCGQSVANTQNYITGLFNQVQAIFRNESVTVYLASSLIWSKQDNYLDSSSAHGLMSFESEWAKKKDSFGADMAMLLAADIGDLGGVASLNAICKLNSPYAYCDVNGVFNYVPVYSWDVFAVCHEAGHLLGSYHTQWCGWMTGAGGTCGSIDDCSFQDTYLSCTSCPTVKSNSLPATAWKGSIMSYCYNGRGVNLANGFEKLPGDLIRSNIGNALCLQHLISGKLEVSNICRGVGSIKFVPDSVMYIGLVDVSTLVYQWTSGATTKDITNISAPGVYGLSITTATGQCHIQYNTPVELINTDSCRFKTNIENTTVPLQFSISPNPSNGYCNVVHNSATKMPYSIVITDMQGRVLQQTDNIRDSNYRIVTAGYPQAVYTVLVRTANGSQHLRLVVQ